MDRFAGLTEPEYKMVLVVNSELDMGRGKQCAQVAHAAVTLAVNVLVSSPDDRLCPIHIWLSSGQKKIVLRGENLEQLSNLERQATTAQLSSYMVSDAGLTQIAPGSKTVLAIFGLSQDVDSITGSLRLL